MIIAEGMEEKRELCLSSLNHSKKVRVLFKENTNMCAVCYTGYSTVCLQDATFFFSQEENSNNILESYYTLFQ